MHIMNINIFYIFLFFLFIHFKTSIIGHMRTVADEKWFANATFLRSYCTMQIFNQPIMWQQLNAFKHADVVKRFSFFSDQMSERGMNMI